MSCTKGSQISLVEKPDLRVSPVCSSRENCLVCGEDQAQHFHVPPALRGGCGNPVLYWDLGYPHSGVRTVGHRVLIVSAT